MKTKEQINTEAKEIYLAIKQLVELSGKNSVQSWWLNTINYDLKSKLKTSEINRRAKLLVKQGLIEIDKKNTPTSTGTCYKLVN